MKAHDLKTMYDYHRDEWEKEEVFTHVVFAAERMAKVGEERFFYFEDNSILCWQAHGAFKVIE